MSRDATRALQHALAAEHAVIWGYGVVGAHLDDGPLQQAQQADAAHRARRDALAARLRDRELTPQPAAATYQVPFPVTDSDSALQLAVHLEEGAAAAWEPVLGATTDRGLRQLALSALTDAAVRATRWRELASPAMSPTVAFPGR